MRWWYLRRAIPWVALLGCCAGAIASALLLARWPSQAMVFLPTMLACCGAAAGFCFDEPAPALAAVTPRGSGWRRTTRMAAAALPLVVWMLLVLARPGGLVLDRSGWWLAGLAAVALALGTAALVERRGVAAPGSALAAATALAVFTPVVVGLFLDWRSVYPVEEFDPEVFVFWASVAAAGAGACVAGLRPGIR